MTPATCLAAARYVYEHRVARRRMAELPRDFAPGSEAEAYAIQRTAQELLSASPAFGRVVGHKIGCTTRVMQEFLHIDHPCAGGMFAATTSRGPLRARREDYCHVGVECEIVVLLGDDLRSAASPYTRETVADAVEACMAGIEIVDDRYVDYRSTSVETLIADDFFHAGSVLGEPNTRWRDLDLVGCAGETRIDGVPVGSGTGADVMGHPFAALAWLANHRIALGSPLRAGELVSTGSVVQTQWIGHPAHVSVTVSGLGSVTIQFG